MEDIIIFINNNVALAPYVVFGLLMLAGFNIPVSEDAMILVSAVLAANYPEHFFGLLMGLFWGAYLSDVVCFYIGRILGPKLFQTKFFSKMISREQLEKLNHFYEKYGIFTLIFGRFIPFGVRNGLFLTAGIGQMKPLKFCAADFLACVISVGTYFTIYYHLGNSAVQMVKESNKVIFAIFIAIVAIILIYKYFIKKKQYNNISK